MNEARVDSRLWSLLACPLCLRALDPVAERLECGTRGAVYGVEDGIPKMRAVEAGLFCPRCRAPLEKGGYGVVSAKCARAPDGCPAARADPGPCGLGFARGFVSDLPRRGRCYAAESKNAGDCF